MANINLGIDADVIGGPHITVSRSQSVEAYDKISVVINVGDTDKVVDIQPGNADKVSLLMITSNLYSNVSYKASNGTTDSALITLNEPHLYFGSGMMSLFTVAPKSLKFTNSNTDPSKKASTIEIDPSKKASIEILIGRDATP